MNMARPSTKKKHLVEKYQELVWALSLQDYDKILHMQDRESRAIAMLATKMRISQQATTNHRGNKKAISGRTQLWD